MSYVSVSRNTHRQKRLILSNLNGLCANFKSKYVSIGFSKFCELWLKWCVFAGSSGTHSVCTYHQEIKLLLAPLNVNYQKLFPLIVCDINNKECMAQMPKLPSVRHTIARFFVLHYWRF